jgi:hypothetical protein
LRKDFKNRYFGQVLKWILNLALHEGKKTDSARKCEAENACTQKGGSKNRQEKAARGGNFELKLLPHFIRMKV